MSTLNYSLISNIVIDGIDMGDYPDFSDAYILSADYGDREMTDEELEILNEDSDFVHQSVFEHIF